MPKAERGTPKDIANRMKAKGLQKLKFYCQMCSKQCRDENGFKCHLTSDSHLRQMKIFCDNASGMLDNFSSEFEKEYLETLRRRHGTKRMNANNVYQEVIQDKHHIHMNATKWATLTDFVQYLGKTGKCTVEETERGWYIQYIERDPALLARQEAYRLRVEAEKIEEKKLAKRMEMQRVEAAKLMDKAGVGVNVQASNIERVSGATPIALKIVGTATLDKKRKKANVGNKKSVFDADDDSGGLEVNDSPSLSNSSDVDLHKSKQYSTRNKRSRWGDLVPAKTEPKESKENVQDLIKANNRSNEIPGCDETKDCKKNRNGESDYDELEDIRKRNWIRRDILVRIISKRISKGKYFKRKGIINRVHDKFIAEVEILDSGPEKRDGGDIVRIDQDHLETIIPKEGKKVRILNGKGRGMIAELIDVDSRKHCATLKLLDSSQFLKKVDFEDFSKAI